MLNRRIVHRIVLLVFLLALYPGVVAADTFTVSLPPNTEVTMQDPEAIIPVTITNNGPTRNIRRIEFEIDTARYNFSGATVPPNGWCVERVRANSIRFALRQITGACRNWPTPSQITPGSSLVFNLTVLPLSDSADVTNDTFTRVRVRTQNGFNLSGGLPTWTRRALEASMAATPSTAGVGDEITLAMQVINRSTVTQSGITSVPVPPAPSTPIVTGTAGPYYGSTLLDGDHDDTITTIVVDSTAEFPSSGTVRIDSEEICYAGTTATTFTGVTRGCNSTTASNHTDNAAVYNLSPLSLAPGESGTVIYTYQAAATGSVYFTARGADSSGTATSVSVDSGAVIISDFAATLALSPASVISGDTILVEMSVTNNGSSALVNIVPSLLSGCAGGATETYVSGPSPPLIPSMAPGSSGTFQWQYQVAGNVGDAYCLTGYATADGPVISNTAASNNGTISNYAVTVDPSTVAGGSTGVTFTWDLYNGGGCPVREIRIDIPRSGGDWNCGSVTPPAGWNGGCGDPVRFRSSSRTNDIPPNGTGSFSITFSTTETVTADKTVSFPIEIRTRRVFALGCFRAIRTTIGSYVTVTAYGLALTHSPAGPIYADGTSRYAMTATLTSGGNPVSGKIVTFSTTNGTLAPATAVTDSSGQATVELIAPNSATNTTATVTATYLGAVTTDTVDFTGWTGPNLQYWGGLSPASASCGNSYSFTLNVRNIGTVAITIDTNSYFAFNDYAAGGTTEFIAYLDADTTIGAGAGPVPLTFGPATVAASFIDGAYLPTANTAPPPASGLFFKDITGVYDQYRDVTDNVTVSGSCGTFNIDILEWRELY